MEHKMTIFLFGLFWNRDITEITTKMMHKLQSWFLYLKHSFTIYCSMHTALLPSPNHKSHWQDTRKSPFQWILSRRQNRTRKIQDWGKKLGTEFVWDISLISMTIVTNLGWMVTIIHLGTLWEKGWCRPMTHQMENKAKQTATSIS
jgi:hypothetical protein